MKTRNTIFIALLALTLSAALLTGCAPATATVPQTDTTVLHTLSGDVLPANTKPVVAAQESEDNSTTFANTSAVCGICARQNCNDSVHCGNRYNRHNSSNHHSPHNGHHH